MQIRLGIPASFPRFTKASAELGAPILISANALRKSHGYPGFRSITPNMFNGCDVALDSAGFVAMVRYGGYPWTTADYVSLAKSHPWAWWAAMDYCCEPQIAPDRFEVMKRVRDTVRHLKICQEEAERQNVKPPMPVLQGWKATDYVQCFDWMLSLPLPDLLGLGSVCRRQLGGEDGLLAIVARLDRELPPAKKLHLFGVKGTAVAALAGHARIHSIDSMAWDLAARRECGDHINSVDYRISHMRRWYEANVALLNQPQLRMAV